MADVKIAQRGVGGGSRQRVRILIFRQAVLERQQRFAGEQPVLSAEFAVAEMHDALSHRPNQHVHAGTAPRCTEWFRRFVHMRREVWVEHPFSGQQRQLRVTHVSEDEMRDAVQQMPDLFRVHDAFEVGRGDQKPSQRVPSEAIEPRDPRASFHVRQPCPRVALQTRSRHDIDQNTRGLRALFARVRSDVRAAQHVEAHLGEMFDAVAPRWGVDGIDYARGFVVYEIHKLGHRTVSRRWNLDGTRTTFARAQPTRKA